MADQSSSKKSANGTTIVVSEDAFQPKRPIYKPPTNKTVVEIITPKTKSSRTPVSAAQRAKQSVKQ